MQQENDFNAFTDPILYPESYSMQNECAYFKDGRQENIELFYPDQYQMKEFHLFLEKGYRRYADFFYRTACRGCSECIPLRIDLNKFVLSRSQKRTRRKNKEIVVKLSPSFLDEKKLALYQKYKDSKHPDNLEHNYFQEIANFHYGFHRTLELDYYLNEKLIGVSIVDVTADSLSSVYFYYDTDFLNLRLGIFSALTEISLAKSLEKRYYYLGFYIEKLERMAYKKYFRPNQIFQNSQWVHYLDTKLD